MYPPSGLQTDCPEEQESLMKPVVPECAEVMDLLKSLPDAPTVTTTKAIIKQQCRSCSAANSVVVRDNNSSGGDGSDVQNLKTRTNV